MLHYEHQYLQNYLLYSYWLLHLLKLNLLYALSRLSGDVNQLKQLQFGVQDVQVFIEAVSVTPLRHNGQVIFGHVAHK